LLLAVPSADYHTFDGLPASRLPEFLGLALLVPFVVSPLLRRVYGRLIGAAWPAAHGVLVLGILALSVKMVLLASGTHGGFLACYRSPFAPPPAGPCEMSYENPFLRFGVTRIDRHLDFGPSTWDLSFVNSLRFNIYPWIKGNVLRDRLPLAVTWTGTVERSDPWTAHLLYVGAATLRVDSGEPVQLAPRYDAPAIAQVSIPAGRHVLTITYEFDDGSRAQDGRQHGPYAVFRLARLTTPPDEPVLVTPLRPAWPWRWAGVAVDAVVVLFATTLAAACAGAVGHYVWVPGVIAVLAADVAAYAPRLPGVLRDIWLFPLLAMLLGFLVLFAGARRLLGAYLGILPAALVFAWWRLGRLNIVEYRLAGDDWLTYESFARSILERWSLQGGENVFYYQPLFRYVRFVEHFVLGDADPLILTMAIVALSWGLFWMVEVTLGRRRAPVRTIILTLTSLLLLLLATSPTVIELMRRGVSEYPTWIALPLFLAMLFVSTSTKAWLLGASLLGLSFLTRTNQLPAVLTVLALFLWRGRRVRPRAAMAAAGLFGAIALLPALHNYYYGGRFVPLTTSAAIPQNLVLRPAQLLDVPRDPEVRSRLRTQVTRLLYLGGPDRVFEVAVRGLQVTWLAGVGAAVLTRRRGLPLALMVGLPVAYLVPHLFYQAYHGYPRHFLAGCFALGAVILLTGAHWRGPGRRAPSTSPSAPQTRADRVASR
jgi:hypothetical protein